VGFRSKTKIFANVNKSRLNIERAVIGRKDICGVLSTVACDERLDNRHT